MLFIVMYIMKLLELFSGTKSVGRVAEQLRFEVTSLDRDLDADIKCDIMDWDYKQYLVGYFDVIWASPPCIEYSKCKTTAPRNIALTNAIKKLKSLTTISLRIGFLRTRKQDY